MKFLLKSRYSGNELFIIYYDIFIFINVLLESMYTRLGSVVTILKCIRYLVIFLSILNIFNNKKYDKKRLIVFSSIFSLGFINFIAFDGSISVFTIAIILIASYSIDYKKMLIHTIFSSFISYVFVMISSILGIIDTVKITRWLNTLIWSGEFSRESIGFLHPNQIPLMYFYIVGMCIIYLKNKINIKHTTIMLLINFVIFYYCNARTPFILVILLLILTLFIDKIKSYLYLLPDFTILFCISAYVFSIVSALLYPYFEFMKRLDVISNHRISSAYLAIINTGISFFGKGKNAGTKSADITNIFTEKYTVNVDNGYVIFLLQYGLVLFLIFFALWLMIAHKTKKEKDYYLATVFMFLTLSNMIDANLDSFRMWPFYMIIFNKNNNEIDLKYLLKSKIPIRG